MDQLWQSELTEEEIDRLIERAANEVCRRKLQTPAILFLEMHKPLAFVSSQAMVAASPFIIPFFGFDNVNDFSRLISRRENVERLIRRIENPSSPVGQEVSA